MSLAEPVLDWRMPCDADRPLNSLDDLMRLARTGNVTHIRLLAAGLAHAGRLQEAARLLFDLVSAVPDEVPARIDLATVYFQTRRPEEASHQLAAAVAGCDARPGLASVVARRTAQLREWMHWRDDYFTHQALRAAALRERIDVGVATFDHRVALGRSLLSLTTRPGGGDAELAEAITVLEAARRIAPTHVPVLELLNAAYSSARNHEARYEVERDLERLAPHSPVFKVAEEYTADRMAVLRSEHLARVDGLAARALRRERGALDELRALRRTMPNDLNVPGVLLIAEMAFGHRDEVRRLADEFAARPDLHHAAHLHLAQAYSYLRLGDLGRHHFERAHELASDDAEREDVARMLESWGTT
jgi:tetratricopeptide (TPR) repeat protein